MAHQILENDQMFSVGKKPWHGLGKVLENAPSIEEGIKLAGLDWNVSLRPAITNDDDSINLDTHKIVVRDDIKQPLGIVGNNYQILQNKDAFSFFEPFVENEMASLETAGSLFNGKKVFILAKIKTISNSHCFIRDCVLISFNKFFFIKTEIFYLVEMR
jgi:phage/plasmid-like protein (TIGR03299 family)